jgi:cephalosporin-C deacetylase-like acetyl esterase
MKTLLWTFFIGLHGAIALPGADLALRIDGKLDDPFWKSVVSQKLVPSQDGVPSAAGGEVRLAVRGRYLCVSARLPEPSGRISARLAGINPSWEDEDLLRIVAGADIGYTDRLIEINPLGAYSVEKALHDTVTSLPVYPYSTERQTQTVYTGVRKFLVATAVTDNEWTVEAAIPLNELSAPGPQRIYATIERVRAARVGCPQERWRWPVTGVAARVPLTTAVNWDAPAPEFRPVLLGNRESPLEVGLVRELPPQAVGWDEGAWRDVPVWRLMRDEPVRIEPHFPTEVKVAHDGQTLAVLARCIEPGPIVAKVRENDGPVGSDDSFHVYLATSGSMFAQFAVNPLGFLLDTIAFTGGERLSRAREWTSGARVTALGKPGAWTARIDIPLRPVATALGEVFSPVGWRILFLRSRPGRDGEPPEKTVLPVIQSDTVVCPLRYRRLELRDIEPRRLPRPAALTPPRGLAAMDARVLSPEQRKQLRVGSMVPDHLRERVRLSVQAEQRDWEQVKTLADWERFRDPRVKALAASFGTLPARTPLNIQVTSEYAGQGYRRQNLVYESRPGLWVTANLYLPAKPRGTMPGILVVHSHHAARTQAELQDMGILWGRLGCAVLIIDQIGHGEMIQNYPWNREPYHSRYIMGMQMYLAGESLLKWLVWDLMRGIDLLLDRSDVDPRKVVLLGAVAAGGEPAAVTAALDGRVAAVAPFNFGDINPGMGEWESTRGLRRSTIDQFFPWLIGAASAPRHYIYSKEVGWDSYRAHPGWERLQRVFALYGVPDNLDRAYGFGVFPGPGECNSIGPTQRSRLYPPLNRWFEIPIPPSEPDDRRPEDELAALTPAVAARLHMRGLSALAREVTTAKLETARARRQGLEADRWRGNLRADLAARLGDISPRYASQAVVRWKKTYGGAQIEGITIEPEPGIVVPVTLLRPAESEGTPLPVVVSVAQGGAELFLSQRATEIEALLKGSAAVCLVDVRGTGETRYEARRGLRSEGESAATTHFMLGDTMLGARLKDLRTAIAYLASRPDLNASRIAVWGDSFSPPNPSHLLVDEIPGWQMGPELQQQAEPLGGLLALLAALYEDRIRAVAVRHGLASYLSILDDQFAYVPNDIIVPSILEVGDINDIAAALAPRALLSSLV